MSGLTYDTGALLVAEAGNRRMWALHRRALERLHVPTVPAGVLAQAWRDSQQPTLARLLDGCAVESLDEPTARACGALLGRAKTADAIDASVVVGALRRGQTIVTSDRSDIEKARGRDRQTGRRHRALAAGTGARSPYVIIAAVSGVP